jgi:zinc D-Ala-D-Ala carboxypeptidase
MQLTKHFSLSELASSPTAQKHGINNTPNDAIIDNLIIVCEGLEVIRKEAGLPIVITSGYRSKELNRHPDIKGSATSQHIDGQAADINIPGMTVENLYQLIKRLVREGKLNVDQCIQEFDRWVHCSFVYKGNKNEFLRAVKSKGKTIYQKD